MRGNPKGYQGWLNEIATELEIMLRKQTLSMRCIWSFRRVGTQFRPWWPLWILSDETWCRTGVIVRNSAWMASVFAGVELPCTIAHKPMSAAEISSD